MFRRGESGDRCFDLGGARSIFEPDWESPFDPVDAEYYFAYARRKIDRRSENQEFRTELTDGVDLSIEMQFHLDLCGVSGYF